MSPLRWLFVLTAALLMGPAAATAQDPKDPPKPGAAKPGETKPADTKPAEPKPSDTPAARGQLPPNWKQLGLTDEQKRHVYTVQSKYRARMEELQRQLADLRAQERKELEAILTPAQVERLKQIRTGSLPPSP